MTAGHISSNTGSQFLSYLQQQQQSLAQVALSQAINTEMFLQLGAKRGITVTDAQVDAQVTKDATTPESRHVFEIDVIPETRRSFRCERADRHAGRRGPGEGRRPGGPAQERRHVGDGGQGLRRHDGGPDERRHPLRRQGIELAGHGLRERRLRAPGAGLHARGQGQRRTFRIGRVTEIAPAKVDTNYQQELANAGVDMAVYRKVARGAVMQQAINDQPLRAEVVDKPSQMRQVQELQIDANNGQDVPTGSVLVRHILFSPNGDASAAASLKPDDSAWTKAKADAEAAYAALKAGTATWADELKNSSDTGSATTNGFIGYNDPTSSLDPAFAKAIFQTGLQPGEILPPVQSQFGWHVIQFVSADGPWPGRRSCPPSRRRPERTSRSSSPISRTPRTQAPAATSGGSPGTSWTRRKRTRSSPSRPARPRRRSR